MTDGNEDSDPQDSERNTADPGQGLRAEDVDQVFSLLEAVLEADDLDRDHLGRLLSILDRVVARAAHADPGTLAELVSTLEEIVDPDDIDEVAVDGVLAILEEALAEHGEGSHEEIVAVLEKGLRDPADIDEDDLEVFQSSIEDLIDDVTGADGIGQVVPATEREARSDDLRGDGATGDTQSDPELYWIAHLATGMLRRATGQSTGTSVRSSTRMAYAAANSESPVDLLDRTRAVTLDELRRAGVDIGEEREEWLESHDEDLADRQPETPAALRERGERLLSRSSEIGSQESPHPAFSFVLDQIAPDEARILRLLATSGPQPRLEAHERGYLPFGSRLVTDCLTMLGSDAGCRHPDRVPVYVENLQRLRLVRFSEDPVDDLKRYRILEAQSHVEATLESTTRPKTVYGSLRLTNFGVEFCETCFPFEVEVDPAPAAVPEEE